MFCCGKAQVCLRYSRTANLSMLCIILNGLRPRLSRFASLDLLALAVGRLPRQISGV